MLLRRLYCLGSLGLLCGVLVSPAQATDYNEAVFGDLSNSGLNPTVLGTLAAGSNQVFGTIASGPNGVDRDYFTVNVPTGYEFVSLIALPGTTVGDTASFLGLEAGTQVTVPANPSSAAGLLGWRHYTVADIGVNILPDMGTPAFGSTGFTAPLSAGDYAFWIQDADAAKYGFDITLRAQSVPESGSLVLLCGIGLSSGLLAFARRKRRLR